METVGGGGVRSRDPNPASGAREGRVKVPEVKGGKSVKQRNSLCQNPKPREQGHSFGLHC